MILTVRDSKENTLFGKANHVKLRIGKTGTTVPKDRAIFSQRYKETLVGTSPNASYAPIDRCSGFEYLKLVNLGFLQSAEILWQKF